jgi:hypothetical protein
MFTMSDHIPYPAPPLGPLRQLDVYLRNGCLSARDAGVLLKQGLAWQVVAPYVRDMEWWITQRVNVGPPPALPWHVTAWDNTICLETRNENIWIDPGPSAPLPENPPDLIIVTHAHYDHTAELGTYSCVYPQSPVVMSNETAHLLSLRARQDAALQDCLNHSTVRMECAQERGLGGVQIKLRPAGHLLGATTVEIRLGDDTLLVTGDWALRDVGGIAGAQWPQDRYALVIMESTTATPSGLPVADPKTNRSPFLCQVSDALEQGKTRLVAVAQAMGQAQELYAALALAQQAGAFPALEVCLSGLASTVSEAYYRAQQNRPGPWACPFYTGTVEVIPANSLVIASKDRGAEHEAAQPSDTFTDCPDVWTLNPLAYTHAGWSERLAWGVGLVCSTIVLCPGESASLFQVAMAEVGRRVITLPQGEQISF